MPRAHLDAHRSTRAGWLRAAVLGANDGVISTSGLVVGVAASGASQAQVLLAGVAGLVAGAISMAAGEYVSVQSQADTENADLRRERIELETYPDSELAELEAIYVGRGLDRSLATQVAQQLMAGDALAAHARDELGITDTLRARPIQAALASAASFVVGAVVPIATVHLAPSLHVTEVSTASALLTLTILGATAAGIGGSSMTKGALRVAFWGALAMALTAGVGKLLGTEIPG